MTTITIPRNRIRRDIRPGDRIIAVDQWAHDFIVHPDPFRLEGAIRLINPLNTETTWNLYPDTQVERNIVVVRDEDLDAPIRLGVDVAADGSAEPAVARAEPVLAPVEPPSLVDEPETPKRKRPAVRIVEGIRLIAQCPGFWRSEDGRYEISRDDTCEYECEVEHPVRLTHALVEEIKARPWLYPSAATWAVMTNARGYLCPSGMTHHEALWIAWDTVKRDHVGGSGPGSFTSMADVLASFASDIRNGWGEK